MSLTSVPFVIGLGIGDVVTLDGKKASQRMLNEQSQNVFQSTFRKREEKAIKNGGNGGEYRSQRKFVNNLSITNEMLNFDATIGASIAILKGELYGNYYKSKACFQNGINFLIQANKESNPIINSICDMNQLKLSDGFKQFLTKNSKNENMNKMIDDIYGTHLIIGKKYVSRVAIELNINIKHDKYEESLLLTKAIVKLEAFGWTVASHTIEINETLMNKISLKDNTDILFHIHCIPSLIMSKNSVKYDKITDIMNTFVNEFNNIDNNNNSNNLTHFNINLERCLYDLLNDPLNLKMSESWEYVLLPINVVLSSFEYEYGLLNRMNWDENIENTIIYNNHLNAIYFIVKNFLQIAESAPFIEANGVIPSRLTSQCEKVISNIESNVDVGSFADRCNYLQAKSKDNEKMVMAQTQQEIEKPLQCVDVNLLQEQLNIQLSIRNCANT